MRRLGLAAGLLTVGALLLGARPSPETLFILLNGEFTKLGVLASTGTSVNNTTTGTAFTLKPSDCPSRIFMLDCDIAGVAIGNGSTCSTDIANANYKPVTSAAHEWKYFALADSTVLMCLDTAAVTGNCAVFCMK